MRRHRILALIVVGLVASHAACRSTTAESRKQAHSLRDQVAAYAKERKETLNRINAEDRARYASLVSDHADVSDARLRLERHADARATADHVLANWQTRTTHTAVIERLEAARDRQLARMDASAAALAAARQAYAAGYARLELNFKKLEAVRKKLDKLGQFEGDRKAIVKVLTELLKIYQDARNEEKNGDKGKA